MSYNSRADVVRLLTELYDSTSLATRKSCDTTKQSVFGWHIYIYIYIYIYVCVCVCVCVYTWCLQSGHEEERHAIKLCFKLGKNATETYGMRQTDFGASCLNRASVFKWHKRFKEGRESVRDDERCRMSKEGLGLGLRLGVLCWDSVGRGQNSSNRVCDISIRTMHQSTTPSLLQTIWPRWASRHFLTLPIVETLLPVTFGYSLSSEAVVMRQLRRWKRLWRKSLTCSHKRTSMGPSISCWNGTTSPLQPEEITSKGTRVSCVYYQ